MAPGFVPSLREDSGKKCALHTELARTNVSPENVYGCDDYDAKWR
jgi:hypothetical protein